mgnify:CR=1 FL=1
MIAIGVTGSLASGKSTVTKLISNNKHPVFNADKVVKKLYQNKNFTRILVTKFNLDKEKNIKKQIKNLILLDKKNLKDLEKIIHPLVRKSMFKFILKNKKKKLIVLEVPLLIESKLTKHFDSLIFVTSSKKNRLKRYKLKGGNKSFFYLLDKNQIVASRKRKYGDKVIDNNLSLKVLKKNIKDIMKNYE